MFLPPTCGWGLPAEAKQARLKKAADFAADACSVGKRGEETREVGFSSERRGLARRQRVFELVPRSYSRTYERTPFRHQRNGSSIFRFSLQVLGSTQPENVPCKGGGHRNLQRRARRRPPNCKKLLEPFVARGVIPFDFP